MSTQNPKFLRSPRAQRFFPNSIVSAIRKAISSSRVVKKKVPAQPVDGGFSMMKFESFEPRILMSADLNPAFDSGASEQSLAQDQGALIVQAGRSADQDHDESGLGRSGCDGGIQHVVGNVYHHRK